MKRLFAIVVLNIFLLNVLGYYGVLVGLRADSGAKMSAKLDSDMYDLAGTVTFKVSLAVPYSNDSKDWQRVNGEFEKDGEIYRLVKQKLYQDTLYIVCVKDEASSKINNTLEDFVQSFAGNHSNQQNTVAPSFIKDYVDTEITLAISINGWEREVAEVAATKYFFDSYYSSIVNPPDSLV